MLLVMDSVTRLAMAQREIGLAAGEPPEPERLYAVGVQPAAEESSSGREISARARSPGFFTVLVEGDDFNEPICDAVRGILDGHILLSRTLGARGHYPAIDSALVSRLASRIASSDERAAAQRIREALAGLDRSEDLINLGAYASGANPKLDAAIRLRSGIEAFLKQEAGANAGYEETLDRMSQLANSMQA